jgi:hypothetical protein
MANVITREHAEKIVKKLKAVNESRKNSPHDTYVVYHNNREIASFGIRRGSKKEAPHGHLPDELHIRPNQCLNLARCPLSRDDWIDLLRARGLIPDEDGGQDEAEPEL